MKKTKKEYNVVATIECRMTSSRLPGKVMMESCGIPMLAHMVERVRRVERLDDLVLATTVNDADDCIVELSDQIGVKSYRGSETDVLKRVLNAAGSADADVIVELTGDCPLIDPDIVAQTLDLYLNNECDYVNNDIPMSFPMGMDVEVFSMELLRIADREEQRPLGREHVSSFFVGNRRRFRHLTLPAPPSLYWPDLRLTLDQREDFELIDAVFKAFYPRDTMFTCRDIIQFLKARPGLVALNKTVQQRHPKEEE